MSTVQNKGNVRQFAYQSQQNILHRLKGYSTSYFLSASKVSVVLATPTAICMLHGVCIRKIDDNNNFLTENTTKEIVHILENIQIKFDQFSNCFSPILTSLLHTELSSLAKW